MYVTLGIILMVLVWAVSSFGQKKATQDPALTALEQRLKLREELHQRMREQILKGFSASDDDAFFRDMEKFMQESLSESFSGFESSAERAGRTSFKMEWSEDADSRTMTLTPQSPQQKLDINVSQGQITIKGLEERKTASGSALSSFSNSFPVPDDCDASRVKIDQKGEKILVSFPLVKAAAKKKTVDDKGRIPVEPPVDGVEI